VHAPLSGIIVLCEPGLVSGLGTACAGLDRISLGQDRAKGRTVVEILVHFSIEKGQGFLWVRERVFFCQDGL
jgi:hypothetical protein